MIAGLTGVHLLVVVAVIVLIFGASKLPVLAKNLGQSAKILRSEMRSMHDDEEPAAQAAPVTIEPEAHRTSASR
jgi:sec-independent protein translocase protein TatA